MKRETPIIDWEKYRAEFPVTERYTYFNHAAVSPMSTRTLEAVQSLSKSLLETGILCLENVLERVEEARRATARLIGADAGEIAFIKNTTQGVLIAAHGIRWREGDNVVLPAVEFPANVYPWKYLSRRGVKLKFVPPIDGTVTTEMLCDACDERTKAITVSFVQFSNGYRIDLERLGAFCRRGGIYLHVDGIQAIGMVRCDVRNLNIDFLSAGGHKWLLALPGAGFFYCRKELLDEIDIWNPGWTGVENLMDFLNYDQSYRPEASRFEDGAQNFHGIYALGASVERFLEIGMNNVEGRILGLTDLLAAELTSRGYIVTSPREGRSGILTFRHSGIDTADILETLTAASVVASAREGAIRLSPHFYNDENDIARFIETLPK